MLGKPLKITSKHVIIIIFGIVWGSIAYYLYLVALSSQQYAPDSTYTYALFKWTILLPATLFGYSPFLMNLFILFEPLYHLPIFNNPLFVYFVIPSIFTSLYAIALLFLLRFLFAYLQRTLIFLHIGMRKFVLTICVLIICVTIATTIWDHIQNTLTTNTITKTLSSINFPDQVIGQKIIHNECTIATCSVLGYKLYTSPDSYENIVNKVNDSLKKQGRNCDNLNNYLKDVGTNYVEIPCNDGITIIIMHNNQELTVDQETTSNFASIVANVELPLPIYKSLYKSDNNAYINSITYGVGMYKEFPNPNYNFLGGMLHAIFNLPLPSPVSH